MKKVISMFLCVMMAAGLMSGCGRPNEPGQDGNDDSINTNQIEQASDIGGEIVLRCGITVSQDSVPAEAIEVFAASVEEATNGTIKIEAHYDGTMGNERDVIEGVSMGTIEMYCGSTAPLANFVSDFNILDLPYVVDMNNLEDAYVLMDGEIGQQMLDSLSNIDIKGLAISHQGFRCMLNRSKDVSTPEEAKGLIIRTMENDIHLEFYQAIGANPVAMASTEAFTALAQGTIDGMDNILDAFYTQGAFESAKHLTLSGHIISGYVFLVNQDIFDTMTEQQQAAVLQAGQEAAAFMRDRSMEKMDEIIKIAEDEYGVTVMETDAQQWKEASEGVAEKYRNDIDDVYWNAFFK